MPRKPKKEKSTVSVPIEGSVVKVTLTPPTKARKTWYAYWAGLRYSKSTGQTEFDNAVKAAQSMIINRGRRTELGDLVISDEEFVEIQKFYYGRATGEDAKKRADGTLRACLEAITAFQLIMRLPAMSQATPDDCALFERKALRLPKNWRHLLKQGGDVLAAAIEDDDVKRLSPNTVVKWSDSLEAAFERANKSAGKKKCTRGVVPDAKLLTENPWRQFSRIEGVDKPIRHFTPDELTSMLDWFERTWAGMTVAPAFLKVLLWSWARRSEVSSLKWSDEREVPGECHFKSVGKKSVVKWFRIPMKLREELEAFRSHSDYVFESYSRQLEQYYRRRGDNSSARRVRLDFTPDNIGEWMYQKVKEWSERNTNGNAYLHIFRKTGLQLALSGEYTQSQVAHDASITPRVMAGSYAQEFDPELWQRSNRTFRRIVTSLPLDVAVRYGYRENQFDRLTELLDEARAKRNWKTIIQLATELDNLDQERVG